MPPLVTTLPWCAAIAFLAFAASTASGAVRGPGRHAWMLPSGLAAALLVWSVHAGVNEGPWGFWAEHERNRWGNQIWFDLLLSLGIGWSMLLPRAKALGMRPFPWLALVICSGSIGLLFMFSRYLFLKTRRQAAQIDY